MKRSLTGALALTSAFAQSASRPAFEIADIHASTPATNPDTFVAGGLLQNGRYDLRCATQQNGWRAELAGFRPV